MECSDAFPCHVCRDCGLLAVANPEAGIWECRACGNTTKFAAVQNQFRQFGMDIVRASVRRAQQQGHATDIDAEHTALAIALLFERFTSVCLSGGVSDEAAIATLSTIWRKTLYGADLKEK